MTLPTDTSGDKRDSDRVLWLRFSESLIESPSSPTSTLLSTVTFVKPSSSVSRSASITAKKPLKFWCWPCSTRPAIRRFGKTERDPLPWKLRPTELGRFRDSTGWSTTLAQGDPIGERSR